MTEDGFFEEPGEDPAAREREKRRLEREHRRAKASAPDQSPAPPEKPPPPPPKPPTEPREAPARKPPPDPREAARRAVDRLRSTAGGSGRWRRWPAIAALAAGLLLIVFLWALYQPFHGAGHGKVVVTIPKGAGVGSVADILDSKGVIDNGTLFKLRVKLAGRSGDLQSGTFVLAGGMSYGDAIDALSKTPQKKTLTVTIPEGLSRKQIAPVAAQAGVGGDYIAASRSSPALDPKAYGGKSATSLEGFLFPATYELKANAAAADLVRKQLDAFRLKIGSVSMSYARKKNLTPYDILTIASMIEREAQQPRDRPLVSAVIYNRLHAGMSLGIDATVRFATGNYDKPLTLSELASNSPYNTRKFTGLPPGPIGNPGLASIEAAARPAKAPFLFYVTKPGTCGGLVFATTAAKAAQDAARYNNARAAAGGKSPTTCPSG